MAMRIVQRIATNGSIKLPAVPSLVDEYLRISTALFTASGRGFYGHELETARSIIANKLTEAFASSPRSKVALTFEAEPGCSLGFGIEDDITTIAEAYERWIGNTEGALFGAHPDAKVLSIAKNCGNPVDAPILDFGAGTGRNAFGLARLGHPVDAVEITPRFAELLADTAKEEQLNVRVVAEDVFLNHGSLRHDYKLVFASEVVPDFRSPADLRKLFELACAVLVEGGKLLFNVHLCAQGYNPEKAARELSQQCYSCLFTPGEVAQAAAGLPLALCSNDSVLEFEKANLPPSLWPPTPWYENWISGLDVYETERQKCPVELRWLAFEKRVAASPQALTISAERAPRFDPVALRKAVSTRFSRRVSASGTLVLPALPGMLDMYSSMTVAIFSALGREVSAEQRRELTRNLEQVLRIAFEQSHRSNVVFTYEAPVGAEIKYTVTADAVPLAEAYEDWYQAMPDTLFGDHPDARVVAAVAELGLARGAAVLDLGAGLGRNATYLAKLGMCVDAVELVPKFAERLRQDAKSAMLPLRVLEGDPFGDLGELGREYRLVIASGVASDFRNLGQLRDLFEFVASRLGPEGVLVLSLHLAADGIELDSKARQWGQHSSAMFYTRVELEQAVAGLPLELASEDNAYDYEQAHLPIEEFPPTPAFEEWATGRHLFALDAEQSPVQLVWLVYRRTA